MNNSKKYPEATYRWSIETPYMFVIYMDGGEEHNTNWYSKEDAKKMKIALSGETFNVMFSNDGSDLTETII